MEMPEDVNILVSMVNMKLRDGSYGSLEDFCRSAGWDEAELKARLGSGGFEYIPGVNQFR
ncbi:MAG: DUF4250 domain-containing protein [Muribaculaceae bacterium]|nr:DUF4250 domain-containing protein [Muribaculaceae bacterium]